MFDDQFLESVRNRQHYDFNKSRWNNTSLLEWDWDRTLRMLDNSPKGNKTFKNEKRSFLLTGIEHRESRPTFCRVIENQLKKTFPQNNITTHFFGGFTSESKSFKIHRDPMDVLYLQVLGDIEWSVWDATIPVSDNLRENGNLEPDEAKKIYSDRFIRGRMIWIPRGTYHLVEPYKSRLGVSFGVEGKIDPSTYV